MPLPMHTELLTRGESIPQPNALGGLGSDKIGTFSEKEIQELVKVTVAPNWHPHDCQLYSLDFGAIKGDLGELSIEDPSHEITEKIFDVLKRELNKVSHVHLRDLPGAEERAEIFKDSYTRILSSRWAGLAQTLLDYGSMQNLVVDRDKLEAEERDAISIDTDTYFLFSRWAKRAATQRDYEDRRTLLADFLSRSTKHTDAVNRIQREIQTHYVQAGVNCLTKTASICGWNQESLPHTRTAQSDASPGSTSRDELSSSVKKNNAVLETFLERLGRNWWKYIQEEFTRRTGRSLDRIALRQWKLPDAFYSADGQAAVLTGTKRAVLEELDYGSFDPGMVDRHWTQRCFDAQDALKTTNDHQTQA